MLRYILKQLINRVWNLVYGQPKLKGPERIEPTYYAPESKEDDR